MKLLLALVLALGVSACKQDLPPPPAAPVVPPATAEVAPPPEVPAEPEASYEMVGPPMLACGMPDFDQTIIQLGNGQLEKAVREQDRLLCRTLGRCENRAAPQILSLGETEEFFSDPDSGFVACSVLARTPRQNFAFGYTLQWLDVAAGTVNITAMSIEDLNAQYAEVPGYESEMATRVSAGQEAAKAEEAAELAR